MIRTAKIKIPYKKDSIKFNIELHVVYNMRPIYFNDLIQNWLNTTSIIDTRSFVLYVSDVAKNANREIEPDKKCWCVLPYDDVNNLLSHYNYEFDDAIQLPDYYTQ